MLKPKPCPIDQMYIILDRFILSLSASVCGEANLVGPFKSVAADITDYLNLD